MAKRDVTIEAAGAVVWRHGSDGAEILLVHRPKYDDWSLPKGKLDNGESHLDGALREVEEETGLRCECGPELKSTHYVDRKGRPKRVRYWAMRPVAGAFAPTSEVDEVRWVALGAAAQLLSYERDLGVVDSFARSLATR